MNILSIGNSFSQDAQRYLHQIAKKGGFDLTAINLYISGCPLSIHHRNMLSEERAYSLELNGESTGFMVSLKEALLNREWDVITIQQASIRSPYYETYQPYLERVVDYIRQCCPKAKIAIHQTWSYEQDSRLLNEKLGYTEQAKMFEDVKASYQKAFESVNADLLLPSGELLQKLLECGIEKVHRDTYHLSFGLGRYAVALLWYAILSGNDVSSNTFNNFDEEISENEIEIAKKCVAQIVKYNK